MRSQRQYIQDILDAMGAAEEFVEGISREELEEDLRRKFALQRAFEIIGKGRSFPTAGPKTSGCRRTTSDCSSPPIRREQMDRTGSFVFEGEEGP